MIRSRWARRWSTSTWGADRGGDRGPGRGRASRWTRLGAAPVPAAGTAGVGSRLAEVARTGIAARRGRAVTESPARAAYHGQLVREDQELAGQVGDRSRLRLRQRLLPGTGPGWHRAGQRCG